MLSPYEDKDKVSFTNCRQYEKPKSMPGAPRPLSKTELEEEQFTATLPKTETIYNDQTENRYFHRLDDIINPTVKVILLAVVQPE